MNFPSDWTKPAPGAYLQTKNATSAWLAWEAYRKHFHSCDLDKMPLDGMLWFCYYLREIRKIAWHVTKESVFETYKECRTSKLL